MTEHREDYEAPRVTDLGRVEDLTHFGTGGVQEQGSQGGGQAIFSRAV